MQDDFRNQQACTSSGLPPLRCRPYDDYDDRELPYPLKHPSDSWLAQHKEIIYDTTENWKRSEFRLRLGTIAINYNLGEDISKTTFGVKVAFKDKYGYPQIWRDLPFIQPDLTPYIQQIAEAISATLSASFVTPAQLSAATSRIDIDISQISTELHNLSASVISAVTLAEANAAMALSTAEVALVSSEIAIEKSTAAKQTADLAILSANALSVIAYDAQESAARANDIALCAETSAVAALRIADDAALSAVTALSAAGVALSAAESVKGIASEAKDIARHAYETAEDVQDVVMKVSHELTNEKNRALSVENTLSTMPINTDRLVQGKYPTLLNCGTSRTVLD